MKQVPCIAIFLLVSIFFCRADTRLDTLFELGDSAIAIEWTPDSVNTRSSWYLEYGSGCTGADSIYRHCDFLPGVTYHSIAYSYGGEDSYPRFEQKLSEGFLVGSHLCHYNTFGDPSIAVAGTDCSGFVCYLWGVPRVSTRELYSQYTTIARDQLDVGDILVKPGSHAVLITEHVEGTRYLIWESTSVVNGCREREVDISDSYWDTYFPRRYEGLTMGVISPRTMMPGSKRRYPIPVIRSGSWSFSASYPWSGTISVYAVNGKCLYSGTVSLGTDETVTIPAPAGAAVSVLRFSDRNGTSSTIMPHVR